jgi:two-component system chemotaxis sensor kinase CheA
VFAKSIQKAKRWMTDYRIFDAFQDSVFVVDADGCVVYGNVATTFLFEVSLRKLMAKKPMAQFVEFEPNPVAEYKTWTGITEPTQMKEIAFTSPSGRKGWVQIVIQPQPAFFSTVTEEQHRWIVCLRDVSLEKTLHDKYRGELDQKEGMIHDLKEARAKLEDYSHNLEKMVEARTSELKQANSLLKTILDSLGQGILVFDTDGQCLPVFSQICATMFGRTPENASIEDVMGLDTRGRESFKGWREAVFAQMLDFEDLAPLAPHRLELPAPTEIALDYNPLLDADGSTRGVVMVATDRTQEMEARHEAERERELVKRVVQMAKHRQAFQSFVREAEALLMRLRNITSESKDETARLLHTVKGGAATFSFGFLVKGCHALEDRLLKSTLNQNLDQGFKDELRSQAETMLERFKKEIHDLSELVGSQSAAPTIEVELEKFRKWADHLVQVSKIDQAHTLGYEMDREVTEKQLGLTVLSLENSLQELAGRLGKKLAPLKIENPEIRGPVDELEGLLSSLVHAFRNALDHGLETAEERQQKGKSEDGHLKVKFARMDQGDHAHFTIEISDDGRGVDVAKVRAKLNARGLVQIAAQSDDEVTQALLRDDFSTADQVTDISGRGVGLAAIDNEARKLGGSVRVESKSGLGMKLIIKFQSSLRRDAKVRAVRAS